MVTRTPKMESSETTRAAEIDKHVRSSVNFFKKLAAAPLDEPDYATALWLLARSEFDPEQDDPFARVNEVADAFMDQDATRKFRFIDVAVDTLDQCLPFFEARDRPTAEYAVALKEWKSRRISLQIKLEDAIDSEQLALPQIIATKK